MREIDVDWFESVKKVKEKKFGEFYENEFVLR